MEEKVLNKNQSVEDLQQKIRFNYEKIMDFEDG